MKPHPYLRAYMAGALVPTIFVMFVVCAYTFLRYGLRVPIALEKGIIFPVALVPNIFGIWNVLYAKLHQRHAISLGVYGACLPFLIGPCGFGIATAVGIVESRSGALLLFQQVPVPYGVIGAAFLCVLIVYYFVWKYLVGFLNELVGVG